MNTSEEKLEDLLKARIKTFKDFPDTGVNFRDLQSILMDSELSKRVLSESVDVITEIVGRPDAVLGFDARGFIFGSQIASAFDVPFIMARKKNKLPGELVSANFFKEYGEDSIFIQKGLIIPGMKVLIHDDLLATGGTANAAEKLIEQEEGVVHAFHFIMELEYLLGRERLNDRTDVLSMVKYTN